MTGRNPPRNRRFGRLTGVLSEMTTCSVLCKLILLMTISLRPFRPVPAERVSLRQFP